MSILWYATNNNSPKVRSSLSPDRVKETDCELRLAAVECRCTSGHQRSSRWARWLPWWRRWSDRCCREQFLVPSGNRHRWVGILWLLSILWMTWYLRARNRVLSLKVASYASNLDADVIVVLTACYWTLNKFSDHLVSKDLVQEFQELQASV